MSQELNRPPIPPAEGAHIIGKGPSLDLLTAADFPDPSWPVLAVNESIRAIERLGPANPVFGITQDARVAAASRPQKGGWLLSAQAWKKGGGDNHPGAWRYRPEDYGCSTRTLTAAMALEFLALAGIRRARMHAFDARNGGALHYAASIGYEHTKYNKSKDRFRRYPDRLDKHAARLGIELEWMAPPSWRVVITTPPKGGVATRHLRAVAKAVRDRMAPHAPLLYGDFPGCWRGLRPGPPLLSLCEDGGLQGGCPVLRLPLEAVPARPVALPTPLSIERGVLLAGPSFGNDERVLAWVAGTLPTLPPRGECRSEQEVLEALGPAVRELDFLSIGSAECGDADIVQCAPGEMPWDVKGLVELDAE